MAHEDFDPEIEELSEDHEEAEQAMLAAVLAYLAGEMALEEAEARIEQAAQALGAAADDWVEEVAPRIYADGANEALKVLGGPQSREDAPQEPRADLHEASLGLMQEDLGADLLATNARMGEDAKQSLREIARRQISEMMRSGSNALPQAAEMAEELQKKGVRFTDRSGRRWEPRRYSRMVLRTHSVKISNEANLNVAGEMGSPAVRVSDGGPGDVDEPCKRANGQVWSREYAAAHLLEHPSCRRAFAPLPSTFSGPLDRG